MKKLLLVILITHCLIIFVEAQTKFQRSFGGTSYEQAFSIIQSTDGGFVSAAGTDSYGSGLADILIVKLDGNGNLAWSKTIGGTGNDHCYTVIQTIDGGYALAGYSSSFTASLDMYIVKLDGSGTLQWSKTIGTALEDNAASITQTSDSGYVIAGYTTIIAVPPYYNFYIHKLNSSGTPEWSKIIGGNAGEVCRSVIQTADGGYAAAGFSQSFGAGVRDMYIVKLDGNGTILWSKTVGGTNIDEATSLIQTSDGGYALAGFTRSFGAGLDDVYVVKLDSNGALQWTKTVGGTNYDQAWSIKQTSDGGFAVAGYTQSFLAGNYEMYIVKLAANGTLLLSRTVGGTGADVAESIARTADGGYVAGGFTSSFGAGSFDMYIVKFDSSWNTCGNFSSPVSSSGTGGTLGNPNSLSTSTSPNINSPTSSSGSGGTLASICLVAIQPITNEIPKQFSLSQNYPNPFNPKSKINYQIADIQSKNQKVELSIYNVLGEKIVTLVNEEQNSGTYEIEWDGSNYPSGVYYYQLTVTSEQLAVFKETKKMVLVK